MTIFTAPPTERYVTAAEALELDEIVYGRPEPRVYTLPLRELTPDTSRGFDCIEFARDVCGIDLLPWQEWWLIHALETMPDGSFRYRTILTLISRQNGKTFLLKILALYFLYVLGTPLVLGVAQKLDIAHESWDKTYDIMIDVPELAAELAPPARAGLKPGRRDGNGKEEIELSPQWDRGPDGRPLGRKPRVPKRRYKVSAATKGAGRSLTVDLLIFDELREQRNTEAWGALSKTTSARPNSIQALISNSGDESSIVLNTIRNAAMADGCLDSVGLFEWSAPVGCPLDDVEAWRQANPALGHTLTIRSLAASMTTDTPSVFRTECLCQGVEDLDALVPPDAWKACHDPQLTLKPIRKRVALGLDVSLDGSHVTLVAAGKFDDGKIGIDVVKSWSSLKACETELAAQLTKVSPRRFGWFPKGPAAEIADGIRRAIKKANVRSVEFTGAEVTESCMALVGAVRMLAVRHGDDPLLSGHMLGAKKAEVEDGYRFTRRGGGHADAAYAAAGAHKLALEIKVGEGSGVWVV